MKRYRHTVIWSHPDILSIGVRQPGQYRQPSSDIKARNPTSASQEDSEPCCLAASSLSASDSHIHVLHQVYGQPGEGHTTILDP